jgi:hypothetical protein
MFPRSTIVTHRRTMPTHFSTRLRSKRMIAPPRPKFSNFIADNLQNNVAIVGKGITLFVMFYTSMNWWFYRGLRKMAEDEEAKQKNGKNDKTRDNNGNKGNKSK